MWLLLWWLFGVINIWDYTFVLWNEIMGFEQLKRIYIYLRLFRCQYTFCANVTTQVSSLHLRPLTHTLWEFELQIILTSKKCCLGLFQGMLYDSVSYISGFIIIYHWISSIVALKTLNSLWGHWCFGLDFCINVVLNPLWALRRV